MKHVCSKLFKETFLLSAFTFGGGYVIISLMKKKFVDELKWLTEEEMLNLTAIAQSAPGPVAVNASILLGYKIAGVKGAFICILGTIMPPFFIITAVTFFYNAFKTNPIISAVLKGMQAGVAAVIADVVLNLGSNVIKGKDILSILIMISAFVLTYIYGVNVVYIIIACGTIGGISTILNSKITKTKE